MENNLISIIVPIYNGEKYIERCVKSIQGQTYTNFEAIMIDDGSTDNTLEILNSIKDDRFRILHQYNGGVSSARNLGLKHAQGDYIAFMDVDDELNTKFFEKMLEAIIQYKSQIVICKFAYSYDNKIEYETLPWKNKKLCHSEISGELIPSMISAKNGIGPIRGSAVRSFFCRNFWEEKSIFFNEKVIIAEDLLFVIQLYNSADSLYVLDEALYKHYRNKGSATNRYNKDGLEKNLEFHRIFKKLLEDEGLYDRYRHEYANNKIQMYTSEISNQARNPKLFDSLGDMELLYREFKNEEVDWRKQNISLGRKITLFLLDKKMLRLLLVLYRIKENIRLFKYN